MSTYICRLGIVLWWEIPKSLIGLPRICISVEVDQ
uniref:Uncharacterized protein n=1 Tax=Anguilla anguilla TaxID=7936 RepID=A0A0E9WJ08_ANGAN